MRVNSTIVAILVFLFLGQAAVAAPAEAPKGFRQLTWGASPGKHLIETPIIPARGITLYRPRPGKPLPPLFSVPVAEEVYSFSKGKFFSASVWLDGKDNFEKILAALIGKYGQPSAAINNYDRDFQPNKRKNLRTWKWPDSPVEIRLSHEEVYFRTTVTYLNPAVKVPEAPEPAGAATTSRADK